MNNEIVFSACQEMYGQQLADLTKDYKCTIFHKAMIQLNGKEIVLEPGVYQIVFIDGEMFVSEISEV